MPSTKVARRRAREPKIVVAEPYLTILLRRTTAPIVPSVRSWIS